MVAQSQRAVNEGVELLVFPLTALTGVDAVPEGDRASFMRDVADAVADLAERLACPSIVAVPLDLSTDETIFDALVFDKGDVWPICMAHHLRSGGTEGSGEHTVAEFEFGGLRLALAISREDLDALDDFDYDVDAIIYLSGCPYAQDDPSSAMGADYEDARFADDAQTTGAWLVGVGPVGCYGDEVYTGSSVVLAPSGEVAALAAAFEEALLTADIGGEFTGRLEEPVHPEPYDAPFHLWQAVTLGIREFVAKQGFTDVALCLDGSLNAAVLAALASDALGPLHVHVLVGSSAQAAAASCRELAHRLRVDVTSAPAAIRDYDPHDLDELELAALARTHGALVLSPLDKTALALGAIPRGVSATQLCPLGDVYRSDVLDMAHVRNTISPLFRRVSFTLFDALVLPFPDGAVRELTSEADITHVDEVLLGYIEYDQSMRELAQSGTIDKALIEAVLRAERTAEFVRRSAPPVLAMSTHVLDDARFPLGMSWQDAHFELAEDGGLEPLLSVGGGPADGAPHRHGEAHGEGHMDLDATLAMLRDIVEQGGFTPTELGGMEELTGDATFVKGTLPTGDQPGPFGWMAPFSEN